MELKLKKNIYYYRIIFYPTIEYFLEYWGNVSVDSQYTFYSISSFYRTDCVVPSVQTERFKTFNFTEWFMRAIYETRQEHAVSLI